MNDCERKKATDGSPADDHIGARKQPTDSEKYGNKQAGPEKIVNGRGKK